MWEPVGPLPAAVYWRRRFVALASAMALAALVLVTAGGTPASTPVPAANRIPTGSGATTTSHPAGGPTTGGAAPTTRGGPVTERARDGDLTLGDTVPVPGTSTPTGRPSSSAASSSAPPGTASSSAPPATASSSAASSGTTSPSTASSSTAPSGAPPGTESSSTASSSTASSSAAQASEAPGSDLPGPFSAAAVPSQPASQPESQPATPSPSVDQPAAPGTTSERIRPDDTPRPSVAAQPSVPVPASGPVPCTNAMLSPTAELDRPVHRVGRPPVLRLVIANVSGQPCVRDLDSARQEIVVWSEDGATRLWSSNDCVNASTIDLRTLVPGRPGAFAVTWGNAPRPPAAG